MTPEDLFLATAFPKGRPFDEVDFYRVMLCPETREALRDTMRRFNPSFVVEVGSWLGYSANLIAQAAPEAKVMAIDTWRGSPEFYENPEYVEMVKEGYHRFVSNNWAHRERMYAFPIDGVSGLRIVHLAGLVPELIFIDGNHEYEGAYGDIHIAMRRFPYTPLVLDDYLTEGVQQASAECAKLFGRVIHSNGNAAWIYPKGLR